MPHTFSLAILALVLPVAASALSDSASSGPPAITSVLTATATVGQPFSYQITASGASPLSFTAGSLPEGLVLSAATISGTPTTAGTVNVTLNAINGAGLDTRTLTLVITSDAGSSGITGRWSGKLNAKTFPQIGALKSGTSSTQSFTVIFTQNGAALLAQTTVNIGTAAQTFVLAGQIGLNNFWVVGQSADQSLTMVLSGQVNKTGVSIKGIGIVYGPLGAAQAGFSLKSIR